MGGWMSGWMEGQMEREENKRMDRFVCLASWVFSVHTFRSTLHSLSFTVPTGLSSAKCIT